MATPYSVIINAFIIKVKAYQLIALLEEEREDMAIAYLDAAVSKFYRKCKTNLLDRDLDNKTFNKELSVDESDILAELMVVEWLTPQMYDDELLESRLNTKDFTEYSPAKLIEQIRYVFESSKKAAKYRMINYTYESGNIRDLDDEND